MQPRRDCFGNSAIILCVLLLASACSASAEDVDAMSLNSESSVQEGRTFGHHFLKRISFAMLPAAFIVGVITTLLAALTIVSMKGLGVGVILLVIAVGQIFSRLVPQALPIQTYAAPPAPAPYPVIYARKSPEPLPVPYSGYSDPVWVEKDWQ